MPWQPSSIGFVKIQLVVLYLLLLATLLITRQWRRWPLFTICMAEALIDTLFYSPNSPDAWWVHWWVPTRVIGQPICLAMIAEACWKAMPRRWQAERWILVGVGLGCAGVAIGAVYGLHRETCWLLAFAGWRAYLMVGRFFFVCSIALFLWMKGIYLNAGHLRIMLVWAGIFATTSVIDFGAPRVFASVWWFNTLAGSWGVAACLLAWILEKQLNQNHDETYNS